MFHWNLLNPIGCFLQCDRCQPISNFIFQLKIGPRLDLNDLDGFLPLSGIDGRIKGLQSSSGFDVVVDGGVQLLAVGQVVAPLLLQMDNLAGESAPSEVHRARVGVTLAETFQSLKSHQNF